MDVGSEEPKCRKQRQMLGLSYPKSNCDKCGSIIRPGWTCAADKESYAGAFTTALGSVPIMENQPGVSWEAKVERAVRDVFEKRFAGQSIPYERTRELVWLEREVVEEIVRALKA